jgi:ribose transport system permease protein
MIGGGSFLNVIIGRRTIGLIPHAVVIMLILFVIFTIVMRKTSFGTHMYAAGGNREAAALSGINVDRIVLTVFIINGLIASVAGIVLSSRLTAASANNGLGLEFTGIAAAVVGGASMKGGKSTPLRTLIGALIITAMRNGFNMLGMSNAIQMISIGLVLIIIVGIDAVRSRRK